MATQQHGQNQHLILVDEHDNPVGTMEKLAAHQQGLCHRAFSVFIMRKQGNAWQCLLQQRQHDKYHCAGLWTNTCCSHPRPGESTPDAAKRRLQEEMGLNVPLQYVDKFHYIATFANGLTENEVDHVFVGFSEPQHTVVINPAEVADAAWVDLSSLQDAIDKQPERYTPWLLRALSIAKTALIK